MVLRPEAICMVLCCILPDLPRSGLCDQTNSVYDDTLGIECRVYMDLFKVRTRNCMQPSSLCVALSLVHYALELRTLIQLSRGSEVVLVWLRSYRLPL